MQIETLKTYCDLVETGSFTKAARLSGVTQSAVSQQITALEGIFHSLLIERSKKRLQPTPEGQAVYDYSKQIIQTFESAINKLQEIKDVISGTIRVATIYSIGLHDLPPYVKEFLKTYPSVNVHVEYRRSNQVYEDVLGNVVDMGFVVYPTSHPRLEIVALRSEPMVLVCHPQHPLAKSKGLRLKELAGQKFVCFHPESPTGKAIDHVLRQHRVSVERVMVFDNSETIKRAVEIGSGIAILPSSAIAQEVSKRTLTKVRIEDVVLARPVAIIYNKNKVLSPAMKQFIALLKEKV